jgi:hypothetical protein
MNEKQLAEFKTEIANKYLKDLEAKGELEKWSADYRVSDKNEFFDDVERIAYTLYRQNPSSKKVVVH